jgi:CheY-like chemotaxis protein
MQTKFNFSNRRVMVVDDESFMLDVIVRMLRDFRVGEIIKASDGLGSLERIDTETSAIDCIIADFNMKPVNGLELLKMIRTGRIEKLSRRQTIIMLTGNNESPVVEAAQKLDVNSFLVKPVAADILGEALDQAFADWKPLKPIEDYESIDIQVSETFNDAEDKRRRREMSLSRDAVNAGWAIAAHSDKAVGSKANRREAEGDAKQSNSLKNLKRCTVMKLQSGMIIGEDIYADERIVLRRGTELTARMIARLQDIAEIDGLRFILVGERSDKSI